MIVILKKKREEEIMDQDKETENPLIQSLSTEDVGEKKARKAEMWFQKIGDLEDDSDLEEEEIGRAVDIVKKKGGSIRQKEEEVDEDAGTKGADSESEDEVGNRHHENTLEVSGRKKRRLTKTLEQREQTAKVRMRLVTGI